MEASNILHAVTESIPCYKFSILPTPLHRLDNLSSTLGINLYCKRDDLTGFGFGGNKTRKLDYIIHDAFKRGADSIVTFGSIQSNWCRMASAAAKSRGMEAYLILAGSVPAKLTANLILDNLVGASIEYVDTEDEKVLTEACKSRMEALKLKGKNPYFTPVGGSNPIGCTGYIRAMKEIVEYEEKAGIRFSRVFVASGSAGTQAGLVAGKIISGWEGEIVGFAVSRDKEKHSEKVRLLTGETLLFHKKEADSDRINSAVKVDDSYLGEGYRINTAECEEAIKLFAATEGIFLDEVYTGKAAAGVIDYARNGVFSMDENILFIHSGGNIQLFE